MTCFGFTKRHVLNFFLDRNLDPPLVFHQTYITKLQEVTAFKRQLWLYLHVSCFPVLGFFRKLSVAS